MNKQSSAHPEPSDELLIAQVVQRNKMAFSLLYDRYAQPVYAMAVHMLGHTDAEEIVQDVFLRLWNKAHLFDVNRGSFKAWFMAVARYRILDELQHRGQRQQVMAADDIYQLLETTENPRHNVEQEVRLRDDSNRLLHALKTLPAEQRQALVLAYFGGLSQSAIAEHLGWPLGTVKKRIRLGMQKLRAALAPQLLTAELQDSSAPTESS